MYHFLMPQDPMEPKRVENEFQCQAVEFQKRGYEITLLPDKFLHGQEWARRIPAGSTVIYRGWMMRPADYQALEKIIQNTGSQLLTDTVCYSRAHHLPNWYPLLSDFTAETMVISQPEELIPTMRNLGWGNYFLKDFVKSLKVDGGSIIHNEAEASRWLGKMLEYRDEIEGGICLRRVESFLPETECRFFVFQGVPFAPDSRPIPIEVQTATERITIPFFSVDLAKISNDSWRIVEIGDGQVSDLVGWTEERFADIWSRM